jgi:hypothetical protein
MPPCRNPQNRAKRRPPIYLTCPSQKTRYRVKPVPPNTLRTTSGSLDEQSYFESGNPWIGDSDDYQIDLEQCDTSQSSNKGTSNPKTKKHSAAETRARFEANWDMVRPAMADVLNDNCTVKCQHPGWRCREMQWTLLTVGKSAGRMRG